MKLVQDVYITSSKALCASGDTLIPVDVWQDTLHLPIKHGVKVYALPEKAEERVKEMGRLREFRSLDRVTLLALVVAEELSDKACFSHSGSGAVVVGSSRGATDLLEREIIDFCQSGGEKVSPLVSPTTTAGNIASYVALLSTEKLLPISLTMTCTSALVSIGVGMSLLRSGVVDFVVAGAAEAPLTAFTVAQMRALRIYSHLTDDPPCRPLAHPTAESTFVLGEGSALFRLSLAATQNCLARISGYGFGREAFSSPTGMTAEGACLEEAMRMALSRSAGPVDAVIVHAPGTKRGDAAEFSALKRIFGAHELPYILSTKWYTGHTFGASGALGLHLACELLNDAKLFSFPYRTVFGEQSPPNKINRILVNSAGFGGMAVSVLVERV